MLSEVNQLAHSVPDRRNGVRTASTNTIFSPPLLDPTVRVLRHENIYYYENMNIYM